MTDSRGMSPILRLVLAILILLGGVTLSWGFEVSNRTWTVIIVGPYIHKGKTQEDIPQMFTTFKTLKECQVKRDVVLRAPGSKVVKDCYDPELPSADTFPPQRTYGKD